jgi:hypothetical protein
MLGMLNYLPRTIFNGNYGDSPPNIGITNSPESVSLSNLCNDFRVGLIIGYLTWATVGNSVDQNDPSSSVNGLLDESGDDPVQFIDAVLSLFTETGRTMQT